MPSERLPRGRVRLLVATCLVNNGNVGVDSQGMHTEYNENILKKTGDLSKSLTAGQYTEFIMADGSSKPRYENMKTRRVRMANIFNITTPYASTISTTVVLTENDIPGASLEGRKSAELKKADLLFWLRCRGDSCKGLSVKGRLVKR